MADLSLYLMQWLTLIAVFSLAAMSPGPDFVLTVRNAIVYSRRAGVMTAFGLGLGVLVHVTYTVFGIAAIIAQSILVFNIIKMAGAAYLIYIGAKSLRSRGAGQEAITQALRAEGQNKTLSIRAAIFSGFLTSVLNPKTSLFFLAIFSQIIKGDTPSAWMIVYAATCFVLIIAWFSFVAFVLTQGRVRGIFLKAGKWIDRTCGALMIALGIKVALTTK